MKFVKTILILLGLHMVLVGCATDVAKNDKALARAVVGQWEWEEGARDCRRFVSMAFKVNGTYTQTSSSCDLDDDGFGNFYYGWYTANSHICFVNVAEQFEGDRSKKELYRKKYQKGVSKGFVEENCRWKVISVDKKGIQIIERYDDGKTDTFTMVRSRWLN